MNGDKEHGGRGPDLQLWPLPAGDRRRPAGRGGRGSRRSRSRRAREGGGAGGETLAVVVTRAERRGGQQRVGEWLSEMRRPRFGIWCALFVLDLVWCCCCLALARVSCIIQLSPSLGAHTMTQLHAVKKIYLFIQRSRES